MSRRVGKLLDYKARTEFFFHERSEKCPGIRDDNFSLNAVAFDKSLICRRRVVSLLEQGARC